MALSSAVCAGAACFRVLVRRGGLGTSQGLVWLLKEWLKMQLNREVTRSDPRECLPLPPNLDPLRAWGGG